MDFRTLCSTKCLRHQTSIAYASTILALAAVAVSAAALPRLNARRLPWVIFNEVVSRCWDGNLFHPARCSLAHNPGGIMSGQMSKSNRRDIMETPRSRALWRQGVLGLLIAVTLVASACSDFSPFSPESTSTPSLTEARQPVEQEAATRDTLSCPSTTPGDIASANLGPERLQQPFRFERLSIEQGLSQSSVYCILQDRRGFMWFGTADGLNRYDGYDFVVYQHNPGDPFSLSDSMILSLHQSRDDMLWVGTRDGGLNRFDPDTDRSVRYQADPKDPNSLGSNTVLSIYEDRSGVLWVGTDNGLDHLDRARETFAHFESSILQNVAVFSIHEDRDGSLWFGTNGGLVRFDPEGTTITLSLSGIPIRSILQDRRGTLWVGTDGAGLFKYDDATKAFIQYQKDLRDSNSLADNRVVSIYEDPSGALWIGTSSSGLDRFDQENEIFVHYRTDRRDVTSLSSNYVQAVYQDREGVLWIGTYDTGINKANIGHMNFALYTNDPDDQQSLSDNFVRAIFEDPSGILWVGTPSGLNRFDRETGRVVLFKPRAGDMRSLSDKSIRVIFGDRSGALWIGTDGGLDRSEGDRAIFTHYYHDPADPKSLSHNSVRSIYEDRVGVLWIGTERGLNRFDRETGQFTRYEHDSNDPQSLSHNTVTAITEDQSGTLWVGTIEGLNRLDPETGQFTRYHYDPGDRSSLSSDYILSIHQDSTGTLWIGTFQGGLNKLVTGGGERFGGETVRFVHYREKDGLPNDVVYGILEDDAGNLWLSTNKGLSRFDPRAEVFINYDVGDGLQSNEFNWGAHHKSSSGEMFFGGVNGFNAFHPSLVQANPCAPPMILTSLAQGGEDIELDKAVGSLQEVALRWPNNFFEFEFAALSFVRPESNRYAYMLEGFDKDWNQIGARRFGRYTNLPGGTYTLRLKAANNSGVWNEDGVSLKITIIPPLWERGWFRGLAILLLIGGVIGGYRLRVKSIEAQSRELERQVQERTSQLEALYHAEERMHRHLHLDQVLQALVDVAVDLLHADKSAVFTRSNGAHPGGREEPGMRVARGFNAEVMTLLSSVLGEGVAGEAAAGSELIVVEDVGADLRQTDYHPTRDRERVQVLQMMDSAGVCSFLHLPIQVNGKPFGVFNISFVEPRIFSEDEQRLFLALAQRASLAIENAQLYEQAQELAAMEERQRLARDLHDAVTQTLFSTSLIAEVLPRIWDRDPGDGQHRLEQVRQATRSALAEMRTLLLELRPTGLAETDLGDLLRQLTEAITGRSRVAVSVDLQGECKPSPELHVTLYRIAQEALNNVAKHARASEVRVTLRCPSDQIILSISDNGRGFEPAGVPPGHLGIGIMRERAEAVGARLEIQSEPGHGTTVTVVWPDDERPTTKGG